MKPFIIP